MYSLLEFQLEVETHVKRRSRNKAKTVWEELFESSLKFNGSGCDFLLLGEIEKHIENLLSRMGRQKMYEIWQETENGIMSIEQGFDDPEEIVMIHDINIEVCQNIVETICQEATKKLK